MPRSVRVPLFAFVGVLAAGLLLGLVVPVAPEVARTSSVVPVLIGCVVLAVGIGEWLAGRRRE